MQLDYSRTILLERLRRLVWQTDPLISKPSF